MIVRQLQTAQDSTRRIDSAGWNSVRMLLTDDNMGFSFHITTIYEGAELDMHYKNHLETVYLTEGAGEITDLATGQTHPLSVGSIYALNQNDHHILRANKGTHMRMVCVFNPPITGQEVHDESGAYALVD